MIVNIIIYALFSSFLRSILNIIDRKTYGYLKQSILSLNIINNAIPFFILFCFILFFSSNALFLFEIFNLKIILFSFFVQMSGYAFSLAFKHTPIHNVIVFSKLSDLFIPFGIFLFIGTWSWLDFIFSFLTFLVCIPLFLKQIFYKQTKLVYITILLTLCLVLQGSFSSVLVDQNMKAIDKLFIFTCFVFFWRIIWSIFSYVLMQRKGSMQVSRETIKSLNTDFSVLQNAKIDVLVIWQTKKVAILVAFRSFISIGMQCFFIMSLCSNCQTVVWPILNSTILFSIIMSALVLKERARFLEFLVTGSIIGLSLIRMIIN